GYPTGGYPAGQLRGDLPTAYPGHTQQSDPYGHPSYPAQQGGPAGPAAPGGYSDVLGGGFPPQPTEPDYGYPPLDSWQPPHENKGQGGPRQQQGPGPYGQDGYGGQDPYGRPAPGPDYYEGGYEDGRFR
ncbi:MAG: hypothetical protein JK586_18030, partial [Nocardiopsis sp. BM-2018]